MESLIKKLKKYNKNDYIPMHMPGGKRNTGLFEFSDPYSLDITEIDGFDDLHNANGVLKFEMDRASDIYHSEESLICLNGATSAITSAVCGAFEKGSKVLVARNCHISVINAIILRELIPVFLYPESDENGIYTGITVEDVKKVINEVAGIRGFIMTSPTYEGVVSDVREIADFLHDKNIILFVDEAHGAHFCVSDFFPESAVESGADIVINSLHKTLPALTQTALLHLNGTLIPRDRIKAFWHIYTTTSPSYVLMGSISMCFDLITSEKISYYIDAHIDDLKYLRNSLSGLKNIRLFNSDDPGKIVLLVCNGKRAYDHFLSYHKIQTEMYAEKYVVSMTSIADKKEYYDRFLDACKDTDISFDNDDVYSVKNDSVFNAFIIHDCHLLPYKAFEKRFSSESKWEHFECSSGKVSLDNVLIYPPGIPLVVAGEIINRCDIDMIRTALNRGQNVRGLDKNNFLCVIDK